MIKRIQRKFHVHKLQKTVAALLVGDKLKEKIDFESFFSIVFSPTDGHYQLIQNLDKCNTRINYTSLPKSPHVFDLIKYV